METPNEQGSNAGRTTVAGRKSTTSGNSTKSTGRKTNGSNDRASGTGSKKSPLLAALGAIAGGVLLYTGAKAMTGKSKKIAGNKQAISIQSSLLIKRPKAELYAYWRNLENLPNFMSHIQEVNEIDETKSNWVAEIPGGFGTIEWEAEIIREEKNHLLIWRSLPQSEIENSGEVRFEDAGGKGTIMETTITYRPPAGKAGGLAGKLLNPAFKKVVENDLKQFKKVMEKKGGKSRNNTSPAGRI